MAKKKESHRERRAREQEERRKKYAAQQLQEQAAPQVPGKRMKSNAKAAGLKSLFSLSDGEQLMTSFGRGNEALPEKRIRNGCIDSLREDGKESFSAALTDCGYRVRGRVEGNADDPARSARMAGDDLIGARRALEMRYFGKTFSDNIHIQLIHAIMDIYKILAVYANNIVYTLDHLDRSGDATENDFIGMGVLTHNSYAVFLDPYLGELGEKAIQKVEQDRKVFEANLKNPRLTCKNLCFEGLFDRNRPGKGKAADGT